MNIKPIHGALTLVALLTLTGCGNTASTEIVAPTATVSNSAGIGSGPSLKAGSTQAIQMTESNTPTVEPHTVDINIPEPTTVVPQSVRPITPPPVIPATPVVTPPEAPQAEATEPETPVEVIAAVEAPSNRADTPTGEVVPSTDEEGSSAAYAEHTESGIWECSLNGVITYAVDCWVFWETGEGKAPRGAQVIDGGVISNRITPENADGTYDCIQNGHTIVSHVTDCEPHFAAYERGE